jgi:hypothetical protein
MKQIMAGLLLLGVMSQITLASPAKRRDRAVTIASESGPAVVVRTSEKDVLMARAAERCRQFLSGRGHAVQPSASIAESKASPLWVLEVKDDCPADRPLGIDTSFLESARADAYQLNVLAKNGRAVVAIVPGQSQMHSYAEHLVQPRVLEGAPWRQVLR